MYSGTRGTGRRTTFPVLPFSYHFLHSVIWNVAATRTTTSGTSFLQYQHQPSWIYFPLTTTTTTTKPLEQTNIEHRGIPDTVLPIYTYLVVCSGSQPFGWILPSVVVAGPVFLVAIFTNRHSFQLSYILLLQNRVYFVGHYFLNLSLISQCRLLFYPFIYVFPPAFNFSYAQFRKSIQLNNQYNHNTRSGHFHYLHSSIVHISDAHTHTYYKYIYNRYRAQGKYSNPSSHVGSIITNRTNLLLPAFYLCVMNTQSPFPFIQ